MGIYDGRERPAEEDDAKQSGSDEKSGEDEGGSAREGRKDHLKEDQKTTSR